jgi:hypothetical protein
VPLNTFLREVAKVGVGWRKKLSRMHQLTYASTVGHLTNGLRKLVRVNDKVSETVYRAVRGELPEAFWLKDHFGMVTATDLAFMSTALEIQPSFFSTTEMNILWEIQCSEETSEGFHCGADVSLLSQFPEEKEMLFPPMTMLTVQMPDGQAHYGYYGGAGEAAEGGAGEAGAEGAGEAGGKGASEAGGRVLDESTATNGATYARITVKPTFV